MKVIKSTTNGKEQIKQCDNLLVNFLDSETIYDHNCLTPDSLNSFESDLSNEINILLAQRTTMLLPFSLVIFQKPKEKILHLHI